MAGLGNLVKELRRRRVFRAAGIYIVGAWVTVQVASLVFPAINVPETALRYVWLAAMLLFPLFMVFSWFFELTAEGIERTPPPDAGSEADLSLRRTDGLIIGALAAVAMAITWQLTGNIRQESNPGPPAAATRNLDLNTIAVLPLANLSGDPEQQFFVSGMQDALISGLSRIRDLKVTSKTSTLRYAETAQSLPEIALQLGVAKLIEGAVFRVGDQVRISVQLVDAVNDQHIWSDSFEEGIQDVLKLQSEVAQAIADEVEVVVSDSVATSFEVTSTIDPAAYEAFLKGQFHVERFTPQDMMAAQQYYQHAVELDPEYALAWYGLSKLCGFQAQAGIISPQEARDNCLPPIERALALDPELAEAHLGYGSHMTWQRFDWDAADKAFRRAIELNPSYAEARMFYSHFLSIVGRLDESTEQIERARELDPLNPFVQGLHGVQRWMVGDPRGAVELIDAAMASTPGFGFGNDVLWGASYDLGNYDKAVTAAIGMLVTSGHEDLGARILEAEYAKGDYRAAALATGEYLAANFETNPSMPASIATFFEHGGDVESAIDWFELAYSTGSPDAPYIGPAWSSEALFSNPRFIALLREMKLDYWADEYSKP